MFSIRKIVPVLAMLLLALTFSLPCAAQKTNEFTKEAGVIPENFSKNNDTLLIASGNPFYNISMKKHFRKSYTGNYDVEKHYESRSVETCRFVLFEGMSATNIKVVGGPNNGTSHTMIQHDGFSILDRKTGKVYNNNAIASPKLIKAYITALDEARQ